MLRNDDKRRIEAEEAYRAQVRGKQGPVKITPAWRWYHWIHIIVAAIIILPLLGLLLLIIFWGKV